MQVAVPNACHKFNGTAVRRWRRWARLAQRLDDPALGELVLADDALGVDPQQDIHAVPGPFGDLGGIDASVEPC